MAAKKVKDAILYEKEGVFIHTTVVACADEDALVAGKIYIRVKPEGLFIEWLPIEEDQKQGSSQSGQGGSVGETDWAVVDVSYRNGKEQNDKVTMKQPQAQARAQSPTRSKHKYIINFDINDLKSFKRSKPNLGWSYLIFILKCGTTYPALHFHQGGTKAFVRELEKYLIIKKSPNDSCLYLVREHDPHALSKSFDELQLFAEQSNDVLNKFIHDPVRTTFSGFSKVTKYLMHNLVVEPERPQDASTVSELLAEDIGIMSMSDQDEAGFELVTTKIELPPRPEIKRSAPVSPQLWSYHQDKDGKVVELDKLKHAIFKGGVDPSIRIDLWKFLLGYYRWDSTFKDRMEQRKKKIDDYFAMKLQWKSILPEQEQRFSMIRDRKNLIDKDVTRTDRTHPSFQGEDNANLAILYDILMTYCMYNFDLGYVQGMSDLLAPILVVMENEVDAFWCFAGFMDLVEDNFEMDQAGMKNQLHQINTLLRFVDPQLYNYLESHDSSNMYFCFRWILIVFKREFSFPDIMRLWEVYWTQLPCKNFHLLISLAILDNEKSTLIENNFGFTEILKHINDMTGTINLEETMKKAEGIFQQLAACKNLPPWVSEILGLNEPESCMGSSTPSTPEKTVRRSKPSPKTDSSISPSKSSPDDIEVIPEPLDMI